MSEEKNNFIFSKKNYQFMILGVLLMIVGYIIMTFDTVEHGYGALSLTVGPFIIFIGFIVELVAIMHRPKDN